MIKTKKKLNISLRLFAIIFSFLLWMYVLSSAETKIEKKIKVVLHLPDDYSILNKTPSDISYTIKGPRAIVRNLLKKQMNIDLNVKNIFKSNVMEYDMDLNSVRITFPFGVTVENFEPKSIKIKLDKKSSKKVPIKLSLFGNVPSDHKLIQSFVSPKFVRLEGAESLLKEINEIETTSFDWSKITQSDNIKLSLVGLDQRLNYSQRDVDFQYEVQPTRANLLIKNIPINFLTRRIFARVNSRFVNLMVLADDKSDIASKKKDIQILAKVPNDASGDVEIKLEAHLPDGLYLLEMKPNKVKIFLE